MTFEQADKLTQRIIAFMRQQGGHYPYRTDEYLQWCVLSTLATGQFIIRIDGKGIRYFACWYWLDDEQLEKILPENPEHRTRPTNINSGPNLYLPEVVSRGETGDTLEIMKKIRKRTGRVFKNAYWHRYQHDNQFRKYRKEPCNGWR